MLNSCNYCLNKDIEVKMEVSTERPASHVSYVECKKCKTRSEYITGWGLGSFHTREKAIESWNKLNKDEKK